MNLKELISLFLVLFPFVATVIGGLLLMRYATADIAGIYVLVMIVVSFIFSAINSWLNEG